MARGHPAAWEQAIAESLKEIPNLEICTFYAAGESAGQARPPWLLNRLYSISRAKFDPFGDVETLNDTPFSPSVVDAIRSAGLAMLIWLAPGRPADMPFESLSRHGVLTVRLGDGSRAIPYWNEVSNGDSTSDATIYWHDRSFTEGRALRNAETATVPGLFVTANAEQPLVAVIRLLADLCIQLMSNAADFTERARKEPVESLRATNSAPAPSNLETAGFVTRKLIRSAHKRWVASGKAPNWFVAIRPNKGNCISNAAGFSAQDFADVPLPPGVAGIADPFVWEHGEKTYLLFEELANPNALGRLGAVEILAGGSYSEMTILLDQPYHLSYPCVIPHRNDLFLMPETSQVKSIEIYRFTSFPDKVTLVAKPIEGPSLVDTTPICIDGHWYFFSTTAEPFMETFLFTSPNLEGPWTLHPRHSVSTSVRNSRSAGHLFFRNGKLYRPTQDCSVRYGYGININQVTRLTPSEFDEEPVNYLPPTWRRGLLGTHTWNESAQYQVIDGYRYS